MTKSLVSLRLRLLQCSSIVNGITDNEKIPCGDRKNYFLTIELICRFQKQYSISKSFVNHK